MKSLPILSIQNLSIVDKSNVIFFFLLQDAIWTLFERHEEAPFLFPLLRWVLFY